MIETWSAATALNKHKALQQFFRSLTVEEEEVGQSLFRRGSPSRLQFRVFTASPTAPVGYGAS